MVTFIRPMSGEYADDVNALLLEHISIYGEQDFTDALHTHMYVVVDENQRLIAFFGLSFWKNCFETVVCNVFVKENFRRKGVFKKIIKFAKKTAYDSPFITICAHKNNVLANEIYAKKFVFLGYDGEIEGNFYAIKDKR